MCIRDRATIDYLSTNVANPFAGLIPGTSLNGSSTSRSQLLRPYPSFTGFTYRRNDGHTIYHSGQFRMEKRFSRGYTVLGSYTVGKMTEWQSFLNESDTEFEKRLAGGDRRHRSITRSSAIRSGIPPTPTSEGLPARPIWHPTSESA